MLRFFSSLSKTAYVMLASLAGLFGALLILGLLAGWLIYPFESPLPFALGLLLGTLSSMLKVALMEKALDHSMDMEGKQAQNYAGLMSILRYFLTILVLLGAVFLPRIIGVFGVVAGVLSLQLAAYITNAVLKKRPDLI